MSLSEKVKRQYYAREERFIRQLLFTKTHLFVHSSTPAETKHNVSSYETLFQCRLEVWWRRN